MSKKEWLEKNGFDSDTEYTYCVVGEDTYAIKDHLKEMGGKYNPLLKWHLPSQISLGDEFKFVPIKFSDIMYWDKEDGAVYLPDAEMKIKRALKSVMPPSKSEYVGTVGERLRNITAVLKSSHGFMGAYGWTYIYTFYSGDSCLVWFSQKELNIANGTVVDLTGTVKKHEEYREVKTTNLSRCIVKEIG